MPEFLSVALAQLNPVVGDIVGNLNKLRQARQTAAFAGASLIVTSELYVCGYPPEDLADQRSFVRAVRVAVEALATETNDGGPGILVGTPWMVGSHLYNAVVLLADGKVAAHTLKRDLPNYGPFDEKRIFRAGPLPEPIEFRGFKLGIMICEDMWTPDAAENLKKRGAEVLVVPNGSPYEEYKGDARLGHAQSCARKTGLPIIYLNQVGGQDELVFDGDSFVLDAKGKNVIRAKAWVEEIVVTKWERTAKGLEPQPLDYEEPPDGESAIYSALMLGLRDYVTKNGFPGVVLGLSGGIDSALAAALAVDALGADKVHTVMLPSPYTSRESTEDAEAIARNLGCRIDSIPISPAMDVFETILQPAFAGKDPDITEENIQSRCRGLILMALSNKFGSMVLSTGNKSEMSVGYATLYGDMCGGFAVLKDLYKIQVYKVAHWRNAHKPAGARGFGGMVIPERVFTKAPTAELRPNQTDQDTLPPYEVLDGILECLIEKDMVPEDIIAEGFSRPAVLRVATLLNRAEYKRRQAPPGVKVTSRNLSKDRRYPMTNAYRET